MEQGSIFIIFPNASDCCSSVFHKAGSCFILQILRLFYNTALNNIHLHHVTQRNNSQLCVPFRAPCQRKQPKSRPPERDDENIRRSGPRRWLSRPTPRPAAAEDADNAEDDRRLWLDTLALQGPARRRGHSDISAALPGHGGPAPGGLPDPRLQEHQRLAHTLRVLGQRRQGRTRDVLLAAHDLQHGPRVQPEPGQVDTVSGRLEQRGLEDGGPRARAASAGQAAQVLPVGHLCPAVASKAACGGVYLERVVYAWVRGVGI